MTALSEVSKRGPRLTPEQKAEQKRQRTQARVGLGSNVLGLTAGTVATAGALRDPRLAEGGKISRALHSVGSKIPKPITNLSDKWTKTAPRKAALLAGGGLALQAGNMGGDVVANRVLARSAQQGQKPVKKNDGEWMLDAYVSKADRTGGRGRNLLSDADYDKELADARAHVKPRLQRQGATVGAAYGGTLGSLAMLHPKAMKSPGRMAAVGAGGALGGGVLGGFAGRAAGSRAWNKGEQRLRNEPEMRRAAEQRILIRRHNERAMDKWARKQVGRQPVGKAYRRYDPEADRQRRLGLASGAGAGGGLLLGSQAAKQYTTKVALREGGEHVKGIAVRPKRGKAALLLTGGALASGGLGAAAYRKGLSERNNPWN